MEMIYRVLDQVAALFLYVYAFIKNMLVLLETYDPETDVFNVVALVKLAVTLTDEGFNPFFDDIDDYLDVTDLELKDDGDNEA